MKGMNELRLNKDTMCEAVQYWLTNKVWNKDEPSPDVTGVEYSGAHSEFVVTIQTKPETKIKAAA